MDNDLLTPEQVQRMNNAIAGRRRSRMVMSRVSTRGITIRNSSFTHRVWRTGIPGSIDITVPPGYTASWQIINTKTRNVAASGSGNSASATLTFGGTGVCNTYDFLVTITNGVKTFKRIFDGEITVYPAKFTEAQANLVIDLATESVNRDFSWATDRSGYKVYVKGTRTGRWNPFYLRALTATNPAHIIFDRAVINSTTFGFSPTAFQNVVIDGCMDESVPYGLVINKTGTGNDQGVYFQGADGTNSSQNVIISGIEINGNGLIGNASAGFQVFTSDSVNFNEANYTFNNLYIHNIYSHDTGGEGYYLGHFTDFDDDADTRFHSPFSDCAIYNCKSLNTGNDGFQMGLFRNTEVFRNEFINAGTRNQSSHMSGVQWSGGNRNCSFYRNYIDTDRNPFNGFSGRQSSSNEFFSNVFISRGRVANGTNMFIRMDLSTELSMYWGFFNNTIILNNDLPWNLYNVNTSVTAIFNPLILADNVIVTNTATERELVNLFDTTNLTLNNLQTTNVASFGLSDPASKNYKPASLTSSVYRARTSFTKLHPLANYDFEGVEFFTDTVGAYSGYELTTI